MVTVVIPVRNGEKYLREAIDSVRAQEVETELVVIDDASTDRTGAIARELGCRVFRNATCCGQMYGKNIGIREAQGEFWLSLDADDRLRPGALRRMLDEFDAVPETQIVMTKVKDFCSPDTPDAARFVKPEPFAGVLTGSALFRRAVFERIGWFREDLKAGDVIDLQGRCAAAGVAIRRLDLITCDRRIHASNFGRTQQKAEFRDYAKLLRERLSRTGSKS